MRAEDAGIRLTTVASISFPVTVLTTITLELMAKLG
jgi:hypothetical protein